MDIKTKVGWLTLGSFSHSSSQLLVSETHRRVGFPLSADGFQTVVLLLCLFFTWTGLGYVIVRREQLLTILPVIDSYAEEGQNCRHSVDKV
jgi:hypothetical protein